MQVDGGGSRGRGTGETGVVDVVTLAFSTDPMARWAYPNPATYLAAMPETIKAFDGNGFAHGTVQGRGYGSALLGHALKQFDRDNVPAYLESSNPRNIPLYERYGFRVLGSIQSGSSPTVVPMLRPPQNAGR